MQTKKCNGCQKVLPVSKFGKESRAKNGYKPRCKECTNAYYRDFYANSSYSDKKIKQVKEAYKKNKQKISDKNKQYYRENKAHLLKYAKNYRQENKEKINSYNRKYLSRKRKNDCEFKAHNFMRKQIYRCLSAKNDTTSNILGYSKKQLLNHLGGSIPKGHTIDHKIPISWFKKSAPIHIVNSLDNLQLLVAKDNFKKNNCYADLVSKPYYNKCIAYIKDKYKSEIKHEESLA